MFADTALLLAVAGTFLAAGLVKGVVGFGLPTLALAVLGATQGLTQAMALLLVPSFVTNLMQALGGGALVPLGRRLWTLLAMACLGTWLGARLLAGADTRLLSGLLGLLLVGYAAYGLAAPRLPSPGARERWLSPLVGAVNGVLTGMTGSFVVPGTLYLQALGLPREALIQAMGILYTVSTLALGVALAGHRLLPPELGLLSAAAVLPAIAGMLAGQRLRRRLPEAAFRRVFFLALLLLGAWIVWQAAL